MRISKRESMNTLDWLATLVALDTTSRNSNLQLIEKVESWFVKHKISTRITYHPTGQKANLFATVPAHRGDNNGGIIFSGHTDVVPVDGQEWDTNPFEAVRIHDKIYGRGTCDMKGFLAVLLALTPEFQQLKPRCPVHFAFSYDEEVGCHGARLLLSDLQAAHIKPRACIVGEPTEMRPVIGHKGIVQFRCRVHGRAAHSSLTPQGCNAIEYAARLICFIRDLADQIRREGPFDTHYDVPFTTLSTNGIQGGTAHNIIPDLCEFVFECRHLPQVKTRDILARIEAFVKNELEPVMHSEQKKVSIEITPIAVVPGFESSENEAINQLAQAITGERDIHKAAYATEAGLFQAANIHTIICGPGNIEQAHGSNEYVTVGQLEKCADFLRKIMLELVAGTRFF